MSKIRIRSSAGPYDVYCASGILKRAGSLSASLPHASGIFVLSSPRVWEKWGRSIARILRRGAKKLRIATILFDDSEASKDLHTIELIVREFRARAPTGAPSLSPSAAEWSVMSLDLPRRLTCVACD